ncbi:ubiquitin thioesterase protein OTUB1 [Geosmithia morbida]|uniref:Ubiquitin thioesterase protein OTUB1 n=1 Tax=Geosmithia morbida TaxID=1094350 RepID=A0A9P4YTN0_9HYPO|nr:ubiquitin thioesterase protein OTUB1 [Geosmithia morbida]KAF4122901.1 ubiquitin thioesterase protein OTUB1 [Geosmithia morbida]
MDSNDSSQDPHGMAAQQAAAKDYQPDLPSYLVGDKTPSDVITQEYARADQTYVEKTILAEIGDPVAIENEAVRLLGMNTMLGEVGGYDYYEDWAEEFVDFLREIGRNADNQAVAVALVHQKWNDLASTSGMIYYLRLLAATYLKANAETYDPFIADNSGVQGYCAQSVELINREIEHLGIVALANVLLKPANLVLEIAYLDRSSGSQVNKYRLPEEANGQDESNLGPVIYLLYRPDHYDILYRLRQPLSIEDPAHPSSIQVHRVGGFTHNTTIASTQDDLGAFSSVDFSTLSLIPGFGGAGMTLEAQSSPSPWLGHQLGLSSPPPPPNVPANLSPNPPPLVIPGAPVSDASISPHTAPAEVSVLPPTGIVGGPPPEFTIRFSPMQLEYDGSNSSYSEASFQVKTNTFKNSVWNRAHFGNPNFHPEEWSPEDEAIDGRMGSKRRSSKRD